MGSRFDVIVAVLKIDMDGTEEQKSERIRNRIQKFFDYGEKQINLPRHEHFFPRRELDADSTLLANEIVLFGADFLNSKRIKAMFPSQEPQLRWLDDSHCKLIFPEADSAKAAIFETLRDKEAYRVKMEDEN